eukprot:195472-Karenia_brevis.AAC.1
MLSIKFVSANVLSFKSARVKKTYISQLCEKGVTIFCAQEVRGKYGVFTQGDFTVVQSAADDQGHAPYEGHEDLDSWWAMFLHQLKKCCHNKTIVMGVDFNLTVTEACEPWIGSCIFSGAKKKSKFGDLCGALKTAN